MSSITRSEAVEVSGNPRKRKLLDDVVHSTVGATKKNSIWVSGDVKKRKLLDDVVHSTVGATEKNSNGLPKDLSQMVVDYLEDYPCFGENEWTILCGRVDPAPLLPPGFSAVWNGPCPIFPGKKISETHMLVYIPAKVDGQPLTLKKLGKIAKRFFPRNDQGYRHISTYIVDQLGNKSIDKSHWALMIKNVLPGSMGKNYAQQQKMVADLAEKTFSYEIPETLEAAVCVLAQYFDSKTRLFDNKPWTYIRCKEEIQGYQTVVGGFSPIGLDVSCDYYGYLYLGVAPLLKI